ncbi:hypothetical protein ACKWTF_014227 [Chironomus riparius]
MNFNFFLIFILISIKTQESFGHTGVCDYYDSYFYSVFDKHSAYACKITLNNLQNINRITKVNGIHENYRNKKDVNYLQIASVNSNIKEFNSVFCATFNNLKTILVEDLKINSIDDDSLQNCFNLNLLYFTNNEISNLPQDLLSENSELVEFELTFNKITTIPEAAFDMQENLKLLNLTNNEINDLPDGVFRALSSLLFLNLNNNKIQELNPKWFKNLKSLLKLTLNSNNLQDLPEKVFENLHNLNAIELKNNKLVKIHASSFGRRDRLLLVYLSKNHVSSIDPTFIHQSAIATLHMEDNFCFGGVIRTRNDINNKLRRCYMSYRPATTTTSTTEAPTTTSSSTTTTELPTTSTKKSWSTIEPVTFTTTTEELSTYQDSDEDVEYISTTVKPATWTDSPTTSQKLSSSCGQVDDDIPAIQKGDKVTRGQFPWSVAIFRTEDRFVCTGVLVSDRKVVTAARCMYKTRQEQGQAFLMRELKIILGSQIIYEPYEHSKKSIAISYIHMHKEYKLSKSEADIAVIILDIAVKDQKYIKPICLIDSDDGPLSVEDSVVVSYGHNASMAKNSLCVPKKYDTTIQDEFECFTNNDKFVNILNNRTFCAGNDIGRGVCVEDYGSGLFVKHADNFYLRGILSTVLIDDREKCLVNSYALYTDIAKFTKWIQELPFDDYDDDYDDEYLARSGLIWS